MTKKDITHIQQNLDSIRHGEITRIRFIQGIKQLFICPLKIIVLVPLFVAALFCWINRDYLISQMLFDLDALPNEVEQAAHYAIYGIGAIILLLVLTLLLPLFGIPRDNRRIGRGIKEVFRKSTSYGSWPIYVSHKRLKNTDYSIYTFFSEYVTIDVWRDRREAVALLLRGHMVGEPSYGGKNGNDPRYIVVKIESGAVPAVKPYDFSGME